MTIPNTMNSFFREINEQMLKVVASQNKTRNSAYYNFQYLFIYLSKKTFLIVDLKGKTFKAWNEIKFPEMKSLGRKLDAIPITKFS